jgi:hypothetical protein
MGAIRVTEVEYPVIVILLPCLFDIFVPETCVCGFLLEWSDPYASLAVGNRIHCDMGSRSREISYLGLWTTDPNRFDCEIWRDFVKAPYEADAAIVHPEKYC